MQKILSCLLLSLLCLTQPVFAVKTDAVKPAGSDVKKQKPGANEPHIIDTGNSAKISPEMIAVVEQYVQREAKMLGGSEYPGERYMALGPLSSCPSGSCLVVLYLLDEVPGRSATNYVQCLATFTVMDGGLQYLAGYQVGGKGLRWLRFKSIGPDRIKFTSEFPLAKDSGDKRSGRADCTFVLASKHLIELPMEHIK